MKTDKSEIKNEIENNLNDSRILFLPGNLFWTKRLEIPEHVDKKEFHEFCLTNLEGMSPFGIEQLFWGFVKIKDKEALVYVTLKDRIESLFPGLDDYSCVFPSFLLFDFNRSKNSHIASFILNAGVLSLLIWDENETNVLPKEIFSLQLSENKEEVLFAAQKDLVSKAIAKKILPKETSNLPLVKILKTDVSFDENYITIFTEDEKHSKKQITLSNNKTINFEEADLREKDAIKKRKKTLFLKNLSFKVFFISCCAFCFIFGGKFIEFYGNSKVNSQKQIIKTNEKLADQLSKKDFLAKKYEQIIFQDLRPFEMLSLLNEFRLDTIYFTSAKLDNSRKITIEGVAENSSAINAYDESLKKSPYFNKVVFSNLKISNQGTQFSLICELKEKKQILPSVK